MLEKYSFIRNLGKGVLSRSEKSTVTSMGGTERVLLHGVVFKLLYPAYLPQHYLRFKKHVLW